MGLRYRKSVNLGPLRLNFSKSGVGYSVGVKGYRVTKTANGRVRTTASIPGTGVSHVTEKSAAQVQREQQARQRKREEARKNGMPFVVKLIMGGLLVLCLAYALCSCSANEPEPEPTTTMSVLEMIQMVEGTRAPTQPTPAPTPEPDPEPAPKPESTEPKTEPAPAPTEPAPAPEPTEPATQQTEPVQQSVAYIGNKNSKKFHELDCGSVDDMKESNKVELFSRDAAIGLGYEPCGRCTP